MKAKALMIVIGITGALPVFFFSNIAYASYYPSDAITTYHESVASSDDVILTIPENEFYTILDVNVEFEKPNGTVLGVFYCDGDRTHNDFSAIQYDSGGTGHVVTDYVWHASIQSVCDTTYNFVNNTTGAAYLTFTYVPRDITQDMTQNLIAILYHLIEFIFFGIVFVITWAFLNLFKKWM